MRLNCLCGACNNCNTLGGLLSSVLVVSFLQCFRGVGYCKFSPGFVLFVRAVWLAGMSAQWCGTCYSLRFQLLLARWCDCWWMVDGGWAHVFCLFHGRAFWRDFLLRVLVIDSWGAKRCHTRVCCPILSILCILCLLYAYCFYGFSGMWLRAHITRVLSLLTHV